MKKIDKGFIIQRQGKDMVLYPGLLHHAHEFFGLIGIETDMLQFPNDTNGNTAIVHAVAIFLENGITRRFHGIGDANAGNVGPTIKAHIIRMAETRAKARALRDGTDVGITAFEEVEDYDDAEAEEGNVSRDRKPAAATRPAASRPAAASTRPAAVSSKDPVDTPVATLRPAAVPNAEALDKMKALAARRGVEPGNDYASSIPAYKSEWTRISALPVLETASVG